MVGSARKSGGGVASVIRLHEQMLVWREYGCYWLETQIQAGVLTKLWYALRAAVKGFFLMPRFDMVHFHTVPDQSMTVQLPVLLWAKLWRKKVLFHIHCGSQLTMPMCTDNKIAHWCMGQTDAIILLAESFKPMLDEYWPEAKSATRFVLYNPLKGDDVAAPTKKPAANEEADGLRRGFANEEAMPTKKPMATKTILFAGMFNKNKAADVLIKAFAKAIKPVAYEEAGGLRRGCANEEAMPTKKPAANEEWRLVLLGTGPEEENLRKLIEDLDCSEKEHSENSTNSWHEMHLRDRIVMPGYVWGEEKDAYFRNASIYVMCSHYEGFPMVVLEAWQNQMAVVTTPVVPDVLKPVANEEACGLRKGCAHEEAAPTKQAMVYDSEVANALVFDFDDVEQLAAHLKLLMEDTNLREKLGENGHNLVQQRFTMERIDVDLRNIYSAILE